MVITFLDRREHSGNINYHVYYAYIDSNGAPVTSNDQDAARKAVSDPAEAWDRHDMASYGD